MVGGKGMTLKLKKRNFKRGSWIGLKDEDIKDAIIEWQNKSGFPVSLLWAADFTVGEILHISDQVTKDILNDIR